MNSTSSRPKFATRSALASLESFSDVTTYAVVVLLLATRGVACQLDWGAPRHESRSDDRAPL